MQLLLLESGELAQAHLDDGLGLDVVKLKALHQSLDGILRGLGGADDVYHLVDIVAGDDKAVKDVGPLLCLAQVILGAADDYVVAVLDEVLDAVLEGEYARTSMDEGDIVDAEGALQVGHLEQLVEHDVGIGVALHVNDDAHALAACLVIDIGDAVNLLLIAEHGNLLDELGLVDSIGYLGDDDG